MRSASRSLLGLVLVVALVASACRNTPSPDAQGNSSALGDMPVRGGTLRFALTHDPNGLDPTRNAWESSGTQVAVAVFDTLMAQAADGSAQPYLAETVIHNADYTEWTIKLRDGVTFHDGSPVDAAAVVKFTDAVTKSLITGQAAVNLKSWEVVDVLTLKLTTHKTWATFPWILTGQAGAIASPKQLEGPDATTRPSGTGPFKLVSWKLGEELVFERNPNYWRKDAAGTQLPYLDGVTFKVMEDRLSREHALRSGQVELTHDRDVAAVRAYEDMGKQGLIELAHDEGATEITAVAFNAAKPPFDDLRVRQALNFATDPMVLADKVQWSRDRISGNPFPPNSRFYSAEAQSAPTDVARARQMIADYTRETGRPVDFTLTVAVEVAAAEELAVQWRAVGATVRIQKIEPKAEKAFLVAGAYDALLQTYFAANDPDTLWHFFHSSTARPVGEFGLNFARLADAQIDEALDTARTSEDPVVRKKAYAQLQQRMTTQFPYLWLYRTDWVIAGSKKVRQARNMTLPDGSRSAPFMAGVFRLTETYLIPED